MMAFLLPTGDPLCNLDVFRYITKDGMKKDAMGTDGMKK